MSVTLSLLALPSPCGSDSGSNSRIAKLVGLTDVVQDRATAKTNGSQGTGVQGDSVTRDFAVTKDGKSDVQTGGADTADFSHLHNVLANALRANGVAGGKSASGGASGSIAKQSSRATALYKNVSQMGTPDPSTSALLRNWKSIMQSGQAASDAGTTTFLTSFQSDASAIESRSSLHLTA